MEDVLLVLTKPPRKNQGIARILEAVIAALILLLTFSAVAVMLQSSDVKVLQEGGDLDRLGYNVLNVIIESGEIDAPQTSLTVKTILQTNLPSAIYYNFTVFNCNYYADGTIQIQPDAICRNITNAINPAAFTNSSQISSTSTMYTSPNGQIRQLILQLARPGGS